MKLKASFTVPLFSAVLYLLVLAADLLKDRLSSANDNAYLSVIILQLTVFVIPSMIFCRMKGVGYTAKLNVKLISPSKIGSIIAATLALISGSVLIRLAQIYVFGITEFSINPFYSYIGSNTAYDFLFKATAFAIMPALTEEFAFRTVMLSEYNYGGHGAVSASVITSLLYAMLYFSLDALPVRFFAAIIFCMLTYATGSVLSAFISHLFFDFYMVFQEKYIIRALSDPSNKIISIFTFALLFFILTMIMFSEFEHNLRQAGRSGVPSPSYLLKKSEDDTPDISATEADDSAAAKKKVISEKTSLLIEALFSPSLIVCIVIFAVAVLGFI